MCSLHSHLYIWADCECVTAERTIYSYFEDSVFQVWQQLVPLVSSLAQDMEHEIMLALSSEKIPDGLQHYAKSRATNPVIGK